MAGGQFSTAKLYGMTIRESATDGSDFSNPDADYRRLFLGEDGLMHVKDSAGSVTSPYQGSGQGLIDFATAKRTSGNITANSTSWANVDTGLDLVLTAASGDYIECGFSAFMANQAVNLGIDVASIVSASPVNYISGGGGASDYGVQAWLAGDTGHATAVGGSILYLLVSGDISGGTVTLRLRYRTGTASNRTINATTAQPLHWWAKNIGPAL